MSDAHNLNRIDSRDTMISQDSIRLPQWETPAALGEYRRDPLGFMTRCACEYGEIALLQFEGEKFCLLTNPDLIVEVLKDRLLFVKAKDLQMLRGLIGNGLVVSEGDFWQRQRRLSQPMFHQQRIFNYGEVMTQDTQRMLENWQVGQKLNVNDEMMRLTLDIVMKTIFDRDVNDSEASRIARALDATMNWVDAQEEEITAERQSWATKATQILQAVGIKQSESERRYREAIALLDETVYAMIQQRRSSETQGDDLLGMLMQVEDADDGSRMSDRQLRDEVATMIFAGHETTANTLSWTWMLLAQYPHVRAKLTEELDRVLQGRTATVEDLPKLTYTNWIVKESMRLYPPATDVTREATRDCEIGGYRIPKGTTIVMSQWVMHRDKRYFADPEKFHPERWANDFEKQLPRGVYFPFGDGPRVCIGKSFALMEAVLILATIAQKFELNLVPDQTIELQPSITLRPKHGIEVLVQVV